MPAPALLILVVLLLALLLPIPLLLLLLLLPLLTLAFLRIPNLWLLPKKRVNRTACMCLTYHPITLLGMTKLPRFRPVPALGLMHLLTPKKEATRTMRAAEAVRAQGRASQLGLRKHLAPAFWVMPRTHGFEDIQTTRQ
jgi:hypothetical protein